jgi:hypothetical protein
MIQDDPRQLSDRADRAGFGFESDPANIRSSMEATLRMRGGVRSASGISASGTGDGDADHGLLRTLFFAIIVALNLFCQYSMHQAMI